MSLSIEKLALPPPTPEEAKRAADNARYRAAVARDDVVFALHARVLEPDVSTKQLIDAGVYFDKVVNDAKSDRPTGSTGFKIVFDLGDNAKGVRTITVEPDDAIDLNPPPYATLLPFTDDLVSGATE